MRSLPFFIAVRYLFAMKSHNVINLISAISVAGMATGTAVLVMILSIYNGFNDLLRSSISDADPDLKVSVRKGKTFVPDSDAFDWAYDRDMVMTMCSVLEDKVYLNYAGKGSIATVKGVDKVFEEESPMASHIEQGEFSLHKGDVPLAVAGTGLCARTGINPRFLDGIELYYPSADRQFSAASPTSARNKVKVYTSGIYRINSKDDSELLFVPIEVMRELIGLDNEVSAIEIRFTPDAGRKEIRRFIRDMETRLGPDYRVSDRYEQNESLYKLMNYEKAAVFLILVFVMIIIAFNVFSSLSMLMIEKEDDIRTLRCLGAGNRLTDRIFVLEGWLISLSGLAIGLVLGTAAVLLQQATGLLKMPGSFSISAYPVHLLPADLILTALAVAAIGYVIAYIPVRLQKSHS